MLDPAHYAGLNERHLDRRPMSAPPIQASELTPGPGVGHNFVPPEVEQKMAWEKVKDMIARRMDATAIASAIRDRLNARYDADEIRLSWLALTEADPISLIRIFCHVPYRPDGKTDSIARPVIETYVTRLLHEKYAATYKKVVNSLKNTLTAKHDSPTLLNFLALVRWVDPAAANKLCTDIGMAVPTQ